MLDLNNKIRIGIAALILIPVLLYWGFASTPNETKKKSPSSLLNGVDYFVEEAIIQEWDTTGKLTRSLYTTQLEHYPNLQLSTLSNPKSISIRNDYSKIKITSDSGIILDGNNQTDLAGNVTVNDNPNEISATILNTSKLTIHPNQDYAVTDKPVKITSSQSVLNAVGMDINFNNRILNLHSRVEGTHNNAK